MYAVIGAAVFFSIALIYTLAALGLPLGEFIMGGQHRVLPRKLRILAVLSVIIQLFGFAIILQAGGLIPLWLSPKGTQYICFFFAVYLTINTGMNFISKSRKEKYGMTALALAAAVCNWITAVRME